MVVTSAQTEKGKTMSRHIDAEWLLNFFEPYPNDYQTPLGSLRACVDDAPSIDIVCCGECAKRKKNKFCLEHMRYEKNDNGFCSYGEREGEQTLQMVGKVKVEL